MAAGRGRPAGGRPVRRRRPHPGEALVSASPDAEPPASLTPGQLLDARHLLDDQTFDALDDQHRRLAARVDALEGVVAMLEELLMR
jgi:hypothetical protein